MRRYKIPSQCTDLVVVNLVGDGGLSIVAVPDVCGSTPITHVTSAHGVLSSAQLFCAKFHEHTIGDSYVSESGIAYF